MTEEKKICLWFYVILEANTNLTFILFLNNGSFLQFSSFEVKYTMHKKYLIQDVVIRNVFKEYS